MRTPENPLHLRYTLPISVAVSILCGVLLSLYYDDGHWLNRAGALVAAIAAGAILIQIKAELDLDRARERVDDTIAMLTRKGAAVTPIDQLSLRVSVSRLELHKQALLRHRLRVAAVVVSNAMLGELLHGFGDVLMCFAFGICRSH